MSIPALADPTDLALMPPRVLFHPGRDYATESRQWQGIPGIERASNGRLWATWYSGGPTECPDNYVVLVTSDDDGKTWTQPVVVIDPPGKVRAYDPVVWIDPLGRLWLFWAQSWDMHDGRTGVWCIRCNDPGSASPTWSEPRRISHGIMMNKPTVLFDGTWLFPAAVWNLPVFREGMEPFRQSSVVASTDQGETFTWRGGADIPNRHFDEHMIVERRDGTLWMIVRCYDGTGEAFSRDGGRTWTPGRKCDIAGPSSRFHIRRLRSGRLLMINHLNFVGRTNLTALLSEDDGRTWLGGLLLDDRKPVSYPDAIESPDGQIYAIHDFHRRGPGEIILSVFTERDILDGKPVSPGSRLHSTIDRVRAGE